MPPGCTVTRAAAIVFETLKLLLSTTRTSPPLVWRVGFNEPLEKVNGYGGEPCGPDTAAASAPRLAGNLAWKKERSRRGTFEKGSAGSPKILSKAMGSGVGRRS